MDFTNDINSIKDIVEGEIELKLADIRGAIAEFEIKRIGDVGYSNLYIYEKYTYAYCSIDSRPKGYKKTISIYFKNGGYTCKQGNFKSFDVYELNGKTLYVPTKDFGSPNVEKDGKEGKINLKEIVDTFTIDDVCVFPYLVEKTITKDIPFPVDKVIEYRDKDGFNYIAKVKDILNVELVEVDGVKKYRAKYLLRNSSKKVS